MSIAETASRGPDHGMAGTKQKKVSLLSLRIFVIVIFPAAMFFIGLLHVDQYRQTVIQSEIDAIVRATRWPGRLPL